LTLALTKPLKLISTDNTTMRLLIILLTFSIFLSTSAQAVIEQEVSFDNAKIEKRYKSLISELRCLVCQNQNIADSDADLAKDLRAKTVIMLKQGASDNDVRTYMSDRYGDFILYKPPFKTSTAFLWLSPILLLLFVLIGIALHLRKRQQDALFKPPHVSDEQTRVKIQNLLKDSPSLNTGKNQSTSPNNNKN